MVGPIRMEHREQWYLGMEAPREGAPRIRPFRSRAGWQPDEQQEMFGKKEAFWVPDLHRTLSHLRSPCSQPIAPSLSSK